MYPILRLLVMLLLAVPAGALSAQDCRFTGDPTCPPDQPPTVGISFGPANGNLVTVDIYASDDYGLLPGTFRLWVNGVAETWHLAAGNGGTTGSARNEVFMVSGTNTFTARICDDRSTDPALEQCTTTTQTYQYTPPPPAPQRAAPVISLAPHNEGFRDLTQGSVNLTYSTPEYVSLDQGRGVTLLYASGQASPRGFVQVDATVNTQEAPARLSIQVINPWGSAAGPETFYEGGTGEHRLAAQWDASGYATGALVHTVRVRAWWSDGTFHESTSPVRVIIVDERRSRFGAGWTLPGIQRLYVQSDGVLLTEGDGTAVFFASGVNGLGTPAGDFTRLAYSTATGTYTRTYPDGATAVFSGSGYLQWTEDRFGNRTTILWTPNAEGIPVPYRITDPAGHATELGYHTAAGSHYGKLNSIRDPGGRLTYLGYWDGWDNLTHIQDPTGAGGLQVVYDGAGHRALRWTPRGSGEWAAEYDAHGTLGVLRAPQVNTDAGAVRPATQSVSLPAAVLAAAGKGAYATPASRRVPAQVRTSFTGPDGLTTRVAVDRFGAPTSIEEPNGDVFGTERDAHGRPLREQGPRGGSAQYSYSDDRYNPHPTVIRNLNTGSVTEVSYDYLFHQPEFVIQNGMTRERRFYSGARMALDSVRADTSVTRFRHDARGRMTWMQDPERHETTIVYAPGGWQNTTSVTRTGGVGPGTTTFTYDGYGRVEGVTDPATRTGTTTYDLLNRVTSSTVQGVTTSHGYDDVNRVYTVTDAKGQVYTTRVNAAGWTESETDPRGLTEAVAYDGVGRPVRLTNRRGGVVTLAYDSLGRMRSRTADAKTTTWAYGPTGNAWVAVSNEESTDTIFPEVWGRPTRAVTVRGSQRYALDFTYRWDIGAREGLTASGPWGTRETGYSYDNAARLSGIWSGISRSALTYTREGLLSSVLLPTGGGQASNQLKQAFTYTPGHRTQQVTFNKAPAQAAFGRTYGYDALERIKTGVRPASGTQGTETRTVTYDPQGRLSGYEDVHRWVQLVRTRDPNCTTRLDTCYYMEEVQYTQSLRSAAYTYDAVGNRTDRGAVLETGNRLAQFDGFQYFYDNDGNLIRKYKPAAGIDWYYGWNALGELVLAQGTDNAGGTWRTITYGYDGLGRRVRRTVDGVTTRYLYDGEDLVMEMDGAGAAVREYTYYPGTDRPYSMRRSSDGAVFYYVLDQPGHVVGLVDASNQVVNQYRYDPWGNLLSSSEAVAQPLRFGARELDAETGLYYLRARYYDPFTGRFISEDPIGLAGGINPYTYVGSDPVNGRDPTGLQGSCDDPATTRTYELCPLVVTAAAGHSGEAALRSLFDDIQDGYMNSAEGALDFWADEWNNCSGIAECGVSGMMGLLAALGAQPGNTSSVLLLPVGGGLQKVGVNFAWKRAGHIFRAAAGHVNPRTVASQRRYAAVFERVANNMANLRPNYPLPPGAANGGIQAFTQTFRNGQVWVYVRGNEIVNAGINRVGMFR